MYEELVERLKIAAEWAGKGFCITPSLCLEAAAAIENSSEEREIGKWEVDEVGCGICSACGNFAFETTTHHISGWYPRFCPNCGAKMEVPTDVSQISEQPKK